MTKPKLHQAIGKNHRLLLAAMAVYFVNQVRNFFLRHQLVHHSKRQLYRFRQNFRKQHASRRGGNNLRFQLTFRIHRLEPALDLGVKRNLLGI